MTSKQATLTTEQLARAFASTRAVLATVKPDHLDLPTPCASWDVGALINHVIGSARWAAGAVGGDVDTTEENYAAGDFLASYEQTTALTLAAFAADGALHRTVQLPFGDRSGAYVLGIVVNDQFTHGWDLARAVGHHTDLDPELADEVLAHARVTIPDSYRGPDGVGLFGPVVEPTPDACPADRLAAFLGRT